jgi:HlyD family secretion protein
MNTQTGTSGGSLAAGAVPAPPKNAPTRDADDDLFDELTDEEDNNPSRPVRRRSWRIPIFLAVLALIGFGIFQGMRAARKGAAAQTQYKIATVSTGQVKKTVTASGTLKPWSTVDIKSKAGGRVNQLLVNEGDTVTAGQVIARIDPTDTLLAVQQSQADVDSAQSTVASNSYQYELQLKQSALAIETARAQLANARASLQSSAASLATARVQSKAQPTQTAAAIRQARATYDAALRDREQLNSTQPQDKAQAQAAFDQATADNEIAQSNLERQRSLLQKGFVSQQAVDQSRTTATSARASLNSARERLNNIDAQQRSARASSDARVAQTKASWQNAQAQTDVASRQNALKQAQAAYAQAQAQVNQAQTALNQAIANQTNNNIRRQAITNAQASAARAKASLTNSKTTLDQTVVRAPEEGVVLTKYVEQGTIITSGLSLSATGTSIVQIGNVSRMYVDVSVDETDIANVDEGQAVDVTFDAYPGVPFEGKVARVQPQAIVDNNVTTVHVRVEVDNSAPTFRLLKPGMNSTCEFILGKKDNVIAVPNEAIQEDDKGSFVLVASGGKPAPAEAGTPADPSLLVGITTKRVDIETDLAGNETTEVTKGLKGGEKIVVQTIEPEVASTTTPQAGSPFAGGAGGRGGFGGGGGGRGR